MWYDQQRGGELEKFLECVFLWTLTISAIDIIKIISIEYCNESICGGIINI